MILRAVVRSAYLIREGSLSKVESRTRRIASKRGQTSPIGRLEWLIYIIFPLGVGALTTRRGLLRDTGDSP